MGTVLIIHAAPGCADPQPEAIEIVKALGGERDLAEWLGFQEDGPFSPRARVGEQELVYGYNFPEDKEPYVASFCIVVHDPWRRAKWNVFGEEGAYDAATIEPWKLAELEEILGVKLTQVVCMR